MGEWPRTYEAQVREAYLANAVAQRAVRAVAEGLAQAPIYASEESVRPLVTTELLEAAACHMLLHGNCFVQLLSDAEGRPAEFYALRPERVTVETDALGWPAGYVYRAGALALWWPGLLKDVGTPPPLAEPSPGT